MGLSKQYYGYLQGTFQNDVHNMYVTRHVEVHLKIVISYLTCQLFYNFYAPGIPVVLEYISFVLKK